MKVKEFDDYNEACTFCDSVDGQIEWTSYKRKKLWYVWYNMYKSRQSEIML